MNYSGIIQIFHAFSEMYIQQSLLVVGLALIQRKLIYSRVGLNICFCISNIPTCNLLCMDIHKLHAECLTTILTGLKFMKCGDGNVQHSAPSYFMLQLNDFILYRFANCCCSPIFLYIFSPFYLNFRSIKNLDRQRTGYLVVTTRTQNFRKIFTDSHKRKSRELNASPTNCGTNDNLFILLQQFSDATSMSTVQNFYTEVRF